MYIKKYWGNFIGGSDDSLNLVAFLEDQKKEEIPLSEIFAQIGLDKQNWDFRQTVEYLEFTHSDGVEMDFHFAIDVVTDLAVILLECSVSGSVNLHDLDEYSIDEVFMDITNYLDTYKMTARELTRTIILDILKTTGITAAAGMGPNLYLAKVAMDIGAKHVPADEYGVRIAQLDEMSYRRQLWTHRPLTDF